MPRKSPNLNSALLNVVLVVVSIILCLAGLEAALWIDAMTAGPPSPGASPDLNSVEKIADVPADVVAVAEARHRFLTMPEEWKKTVVQIPGAAFSYKWHGALHVHNADNMRHIGPYPAKPQGVYRVIVVGDSLTYGYGIPQSATFVELLNTHMSPNYQIEFLNLGISGAQSEDIVKTIKNFLPTLNPNLVIYAICLNDFLPSGIGQYHYSYSFPIPTAMKNFLFKHTRAAGYLSDLYDGALRRFHIRQDFYDDILGDFGDYHKRFSRDVADMNVTVQAAGLPPLVAMVVDQYPGNPKSRQIATIAEAAILNASAVLIPTVGYYRSYANTSFAVSRWEGHPNEIVNYIWATMISKSLRGGQDLQAFARGSSHTATDIEPPEAPRSKMPSAQ